MIEHSFDGEFDARTLADADMIRNDPKRMKGAKAAAGKLIKGKEDMLRGLKKVVRSAPRKGKA